MDAIRLSTDGLQTLATQHVAAADDVATRLPGGGSSRSGQATSAAVAGVNTLVGAAAQLLAARLAATGSKVGVVGATMAERDHASAQQVAAVHPTNRF